MQENSIENSKNNKFLEFLNNKKQFLIFVMLLLVITQVIFFIFLILFGESSVFMDFHIYYASVQVFLQGGWPALFQTFTDYSSVYGWVYPPYMIFFYIPFGIIPPPFNYLVYILFLDAIVFFLLKWMYDLDEELSKILLLFFGIYLEFFILNSNFIILFGIILILYFKNNNFSITNSMIFGIIAGLIIFKPNWILLAPFLFILLYKKDRKKALYFLIAFVITIILVNLFLLLPNMLNLYLNRVNQVNLAFSTPITFLTIRVEHYLYLLPAGLIILKMLREEFPKFDDAWKRVIKKDWILYLVIFVVANILWCLQIYFVFFA